MGSRSSAVALFLCLNLILFIYTSAAGGEKEGGGEKGKEGGEKEGGGKEGGEKQGGKEGGEKQGGKGRECRRGSKQCGKEEGGGQKEGGKEGGSEGGEKCPIDALKLGVCADVLRDLLKIKIGKPPVKPCCHLIGHLVDAEAALCLCTAVQAVSGLGLKLDVPLALTLLLNACGKKPPPGFQCPVTN